MTIRNALLAAMIAAVPVSTAAAAVRPSTAVPMAGSTVAAQGPMYDADRRTEAWPIILGLVGMGALILYFVFEDDDGEAFDEPISPG